MPFNSFEGQIIAVRKNSEDATDVDDISVVNTDSVGRRSAENVLLLDKMIPIWKNSENPFRISCSLPVRIFHNDLFL